MEKKLYMMPQTNVVEIKTKGLLAGSQFDIPVLSAILMMK